MLDYIRETPDVLLDIISNSETYTRSLVDFYLDNHCEGLYLIASGSSYNGSFIARPFMRYILNEEIRLETPFTFVNHEIRYIGKQMFLGVSQSGCSTNTLDALKQLKENGVPCACLVGRDDCDARDIADLCVNWKVGEEKVGFVTKGVSSLACFLMCFSLELARARNLIDEEKYAYAKDQLRKTQVLQPQMVDNTIDLFSRQKEDFLNPSRVVLLSSGPQFGTIMEGALKIAETSCLTAVPYEAEEFLHGPLYPSKPEDLILIVDNGDHPSSERMIDIALALYDITRKVYVVTDSEKIDPDHRFSVNDQTCRYSAPLYKLACLQTLAYLMTEATNRYEPHDCVKQFKKANKVASKTREDLYLNLQNIK